MKQKIIIHAGFHKTGTSTIQAQLNEIRGQFAGTIHFLVQGDPELRALERVSRAFDRNPHAVNHWRLRRSWRKLFDRVALIRVPTIVISSENLLGRIPSARDDSAIYSNVEDIISALRQEAGAFQLNLILYFRDGQAWLDSLHRHLVRTRGIRLSLQQLSSMNKFINPNKALSDTANRIERALQREIIRVDFEDEIKSQNGLGEEILRRAGLTEHDLKKINRVKPQNIGISRAEADNLQLLSPAMSPKAIGRIFARFRSRIK